MAKHTPQRIELRIFPRHGHRRSYIIETRGHKVIATFGRVGHNGRTIETDCGNAKKARKVMIRRALVQLDAGFRPVDLRTGRCLRGARNDNFRDQLQGLLAQIGVVRAISKQSTSRGSKITKKKSKKKQQQTGKTTTTNPKKHKQKQTTKKPAAARKARPTSNPIATTNSSLGFSFGGFHPSPQVGSFFDSSDSGRFSWGGTSTTISPSKFARLGAPDGVFDSASLDSAPSASLASKSFSAAETPNPKPLLLWVDDKPENNDKFVRQIVAGGAIEVVQLTSTRQSKDFLQQRRHLNETDHAHFRIITDRTRQEQGEEIFEWNYRAGEELIIWLRENGWTTPAMLFCSQPEEALQLEKQYLAVRVSRTPDEGVEFGSMRMTFTS